MAEGRLTQTQTRGPDAFVRFAQDMMFRIKAAKGLRQTIHMCAHSDNGALGFVINKSVENLAFEDLLEHLKLESEAIKVAPPIHFGGPVETERGFVIHSEDYVHQETAVPVTGHIGVTATLDILEAIAKGDGPKKSLLVLGYAGWAPGQLEAEIQSNGWLHCDADEEIVFDSDNDDKWERALAKLGVDAAMLSANAGSA